MVQNVIKLKKYWRILEIKNKRKFIETLISNAPNESVWSSEGFGDREIMNFLKKYHAEDGIYLKRGTIFPKEKIFKVKLNEIAKRELIKMIPFWDFNVNFDHQYIYDNERIYFSSFDNLDPTTTWLSKDFNEKFLEYLQKQNVLKYSKVE